MASLSEEKMSISNVDHGWFLTGLNQLWNTKMSHLITLAKLKGFYLFSAQTNFAFAKAMVIH
jgi:hypothetical protein